MSTNRLAHPTVDFGKKHDIFSSTAARQRGTGTVINLCGKLSKRSQLLK